MGDVIFNGVSASSIGLVVQAPPEEEYAEKDVTLTHVKGRNGDIIIDSNSYMNVRRRYVFAAMYNSQVEFNNLYNRVVSWLHSANGYAELSDTYTDTFRLAIYKDEGSLVNLFDQGTGFEINFECKPQRFLSAGRIVSIVPNDGQYYLFNNPTNQIARPIIEFDAKETSSETSMLRMKDHPLSYRRYPLLDIPSDGWYAWNATSVTPDTPVGLLTVITKSEYPKIGSSVYNYNDFRQYGIETFIDTVSDFIPNGFAFEFIVCRNTENYTLDKHWIVTANTSVSATGIVNSEMMECYDEQDGSLYLINNRIAISGNEGFPCLYPGNNYIKIGQASSSDAELKITPNYWHL